MWVLSVDIKYQYSVSVFSIGIQYGCSVWVLTLAPTLSQSGREAFDPKSRFEDPSPLVGKDLSVNPVSTLRCLNTQMSQHSDVSTLRCLNTQMSQHSDVSTADRKQSVQDRAPMQTNAQCRPMLNADQCSMQDCRALETMGRNNIGIWTEQHYGLPTE